MEAAKIEWERIESVFVEDDVYESINAPQWVDFLLSTPLHYNHHHHDDDVAWFCRPDCKHPTTADDFLNSTPTSPFKLLRSASLSKLIGLVDWTRREPNLKRRGVVPHHSSTAPNQDSENQRPNSNLSSPCRQITYLSKASIKSSAQKSKGDEEEDEEYSDILLASSHDNVIPTQSKDLFSKITEFCNDLKKMATHTKQDDQSHNQFVSSPSSYGKDRIVLGPLEKRPKERLPLLQVLTPPPAERSNAKGTPRKNKIKRADEAENIPLSLDLNSMKVKEEKKVRTNPPTPQGFSASKTGASKSPKSRLKERETIGEVGLKKRVKEDDGETSILSHQEGKHPSLDVFWLFKPCALSN